MKEPLLELYFFETCPYCQKVIKKIHELKLAVIYKDTNLDSKNRDKLVEVTGRRTVPCLFIDEKPMHESLDIINWLQNNQNSLEKL